MFSNSEEYRLPVLKSYLVALPNTPRAHSSKIPIRALCRAQSGEWESKPSQGNPFSALIRHNLPRRVTANAGFSPDTPYTPRF